MALAALGSRTPRDPPVAAEQARWTLLAQIESDGRAGTQVMFNLWQIAESYPATAKLIGVRGSLPAFDYGIEFKDAAGQDFHRHASGTLHRTPWLEYLTGKHTYNPVLPPVFHTFTSLFADNFVIPQRHQRFVAVPPETSSTCGSGG